MKIGARQLDRKLGHTLRRDKIQTVIETLVLVNEKKMEWDKLKWAKIKVKCRFMYFFWCEVSCVTAFLNVIDKTLNRRHRISIAKKKKKKKNEGFLSSRKREGLLRKM